MSPVHVAAGRLAKLVCAAAVAILAASPAWALVIDAGFSSAITGASDAAQIESSIDTAITDVENLYGNPGTVSILFTSGSGSSFLGESLTAYDSIPYSEYTSLLKADAAAHPKNTTLATAVANLPYGNDANGSREIAVTTALLRVGLGLSVVTPCFNASGNFVNGCNATYDGIVTLNTTNNLQYTRPVTSNAYDSVSIVEHEVDEILGGGGGGSTLNVIADVGSNNPNDALSSDDGPLDLYRYSGVHKPSFTTSGSPATYFSVDGGVTDIMRFNQNSNYDYGDWYFSGSCPDNPAYVQDTVGCPGQTANESLSSPEYPMMLAIGYDPVPEPGSLALLAGAIAGLVTARRHGRGRDGAAPAQVDCPADCPAACG